MRAVTSCIPSDVTGWDALPDPIGIGYIPVYVTAKGRMKSSLGCCTQDEARRIVAAFCGRNVPRRRQRK